ncbi:helix-turn-helix domain-containing protein [Staphylococcus pettenkoferi]|uniref:helix-turn-helix domain-containing protein n=1 Tax=Staphylococcus pettenkoferi TaxID=170573 RepID=UPI001F5BD5B5|nr:helix-turn-helix domain-containing protein [Staphylococcus pettenkoferi]
MNNFSKEKIETGFTQIPNEILHNPNTTAKAKWLHCYLISRPDDWTFYLSEIVNNTKEGRTVIESAMNELIEHGYVTRTRMRDKQGRLGAYHYHVRYTPVQISYSRLSTVENLQQINYSRKPTSTNTDRTNTDLTNKDSNNTDNNISATKVTQEQFNQWWNLYDKKLDKKKAFSLFKSALKKHDFETIMNGTKAYKQTITNKQYQKYPKTFLSQESYMNDYSEEIPKTSEENENSNYLSQLLNEEA